MKHRNFSFVALAAFAAVAALFAGCRKSEAELFGYKGADLKKSMSDGESFFMVAPGVTNYLPRRVLSVWEKYDFEPCETALVAAAGIVQPSETLARIPAGYAKLSEEPWYTTWSKDSEAFGVKGKVGFVSHFDEDAGKWETGESYFTTHWKTREEALAQLERFAGLVTLEYGAKKLYRFNDCWAAEYRRLRVLGAVGQNALGLWSCMISIQDKNLPGCGLAESVEVQQEMLDRHLYEKALKKYEKDVNEIIESNHAKVEARRKERSLTALEGEAEWARRGEIVYSADVGGALAPSVDFGNIEAFRDARWNEIVSKVEKAFGVSCPTGAVERTVFEGGLEERSFRAGNDLYDVRVSALFPPEKTEENEKRFPPEAFNGEWRIHAVEKLLDGAKLPERPQEKK